MTSIFKDTMKMTAAYSLAQMIFGILIILCIGIIIGGILAIKKAGTANKEQKETWLTIGWISVIIGATPLVLLMMPQLLIGFGRGAGYIFANMAIEELF